MSLRVLWEPGSGALGRQGWGVGWEGVGGGVGVGWGGGGALFPSVFPMEVSMRCRASVWWMLIFPGMLSAHHSSSKWMRGNWTLRLILLLLRYRLWLSV